MLNPWVLLNEVLVGSANEGEKIMRQNGVRSNVRFPYSSGMKKGGKAKKQGYKDREDESISARRGKESTKKQSFKDRRDESYGKWGKRKRGKINR